jgi:ferrous iron transport protein A
MTDKQEVPLSSLKAGQSGIVTRIQGGQGIINRLSALGIRSGRRVTKISSMFMRGPVTVQVGNSQIAIGFGMANKVMLELT